MEQKIAETYQRKFDENSDKPSDTQTGTGSNGAGLSSSSFANLRKRALDAGRQQMMQNIIKDSHNEESKNLEGDEPKNKPLQWSSLQEMKKPDRLPSLGALPVPKFLQEQRDRMQSQQVQMSHQAMMDSQRFAYQQTPSDNLSSIFN